MHALHSWHTDDWACGALVRPQAGVSVQSHADGGASALSDSEADVVESLHGWVASRPASRAASSHSDRELRPQQADEEQQQPRSRSAAHASPAPHLSMLDDGLDMDEALEAEQDGLIHTPLFPVYIEDETDSQLDEVSITLCVRLFELACSWRNLTEGCLQMPTAGLQLQIDTLSSAGEVQDAVHDEQTPLSTIATAGSDALEAWVPPAGSTQNQTADALAPHRCMPFAFSLACSAAAAQPQHNAAILCTTCDITLLQPAEHAGLQAWAAAGPSTPDHTP